MHSFAKRLKTFIIMILIAALCIGAVTFFASIHTEPKPDTNQAVPVSSEQSEKSTSVLPSDSSRSEKNNHIIINDEIRGIWISYMTLDMSGTDRSEKTFRAKIDSIISDCIHYHLNTIIVQVRPFCDAIYPSEIFPFSHIISGEQGKAVDYDPLSYIVKAAHSQNIAVHAWVNPFRICTADTPNKLSDSNPYQIWSSDDNKDNDMFTMEYQGGKYLNPAYPEVRKLITDGIVEIIQNYEVDGIQLDDYFYPDEDTSLDSISYRLYADAVPEGNICLSQSEWREANINSLISGIYTAVHSTDNDVLFGISPQCNFDNNQKISADIRSWCSVKGYIDYICPQIYVSDNHPVFPFEDLAKKWKDTVKEKDIRLYFGLALYKAGTNADEGTWLDSDDNLKTQIELSRKLKTDGFMLYSYDFLNSENTEKELNNLFPIMQSTLFIASAPLPKPFGVFVF